MTARPYRLRVLLDVELTEQEWADLGRTTLGQPERRLVLQVIDTTGRDSAGNEVPEFVALLPATPARLELNLDRGARLEREAQERRGAPTAPSSVPSSDRTAVDPLELLEPKEGPQ